MGRKIKKTEFDKVQIAFEFYKIVGVEIPEIDFEELILNPTKTKKEFITLDFGQEFPWRLSMLFLLGEGDRFALTSNNIVAIFYGIPRLRKNLLEPYLLEVELTSLRISFGEKENYFLDWQSKSIIKF